MLNEKNGKRLRVSPKMPVKERLALYSSAPTETGCIEWRGSSGKAGYGRIGVNGTLMLPHRLAYIEANGEIPEGMWVLHSCDNPKCINPEHLRVGTPSDNASDRLIRNRAWVPKGVESPHAKLTESQVIAIRKDGRRHKDIAKEHGVSRATIGDIKSGKSWKCLLDQNKR